jgi:hypothetical protein
MLADYGKSVKQIVRRGGAFNYYMRGGVSAWGISFLLWVVSVLVAFRWWLLLPNVGVKGFTACLLMITEISDNAQRRSHIKKSHLYGGLFCFPAVVMSLQVHTIETVRTAPNDCPGLHKLR